MSQSVAVIVAAVITGLATLVAAFVARSAKSTSTEGARNNSVWLLVAVMVCGIVIFSLMIGVVGILYENEGLKGLAAIAGMFSGVAAFFILGREMNRQ